MDLSSNNLLLSNNNNKRIIRENSKSQTMELDNETKSTSGCLIKNNHMQNRQFCKYRQVTGKHEWAYQLTMFLCSMNATVCKHLGVPCIYLDPIKFESRWIK